MDELIIEWLQKILNRLRRPESLYVFLEAINMTMFKLRVLFPPVKDADVANRAFNYSINGEAGTLVSLPKDALEYEILAPRDADVVLSLVDVDGSGNQSLPSTRTFKVVDTIPPQQPGELSVTVTEQIETP